MSLLAHIRIGNCRSCGHDHGDGNGSPREQKLKRQIDELNQRVAELEQPVAAHEATLLAGVQMLCVSASQEYSRCKGVIPDWDKGFFSGQLHIFDMYTSVDKSAITEAREYLDKLSSPPQQEPVVAAGGWDAEFRAAWKD